MEKRSFGKDKTNTPDKRQRVAITNTVHSKNRHERGSIDGVDEKQAAIGADETKEETKPIRVFTIKAHGARLDRIRGDFENITPSTMPPEPMPPNIAFVVLHHGKHKGKGNMLGNSVINQFITRFIEGELAALEKTNKDSIHGVISTYKEIYNNLVHHIFKENLQSLRDTIKYTDKVGIFKEAIEDNKKLTEFRSALIKTIKKDGDKVYKQILKRITEEIRVHGELTPSLVWASDFSNELGDAYIEFGPPIGKQKMDQIVEHYTYTPFVSKETVIDKKATSRNHKIVRLHDQIISEYKQYRQTYPYRENDYFVYILEVCLASQK